MSIETEIGIKQRISQLLAGLSEGLYEREESIRLALLSAVAGESIFLLGPPGVGKSLVARRLKFAFKDGISFEYLMSKFSTPDEVFGPVSIKKLKDEDKYERLTTGYLPQANVVFLDEIWKAGPAIQNALLTILNEKIYRNGQEDMKVNIRGIITASNELPPPNQNLAPIWDRFLIRLELDNIRQFQHFLSMIVDTKDVYEDAVPDAIKLQEKELTAWDEQIDQIEVPAEVLNSIQVIKVKLDELQKADTGALSLTINDRRWKKIIRLLRTSAFLNGRSKVDLMDCFLLRHCLWARPEQQSRINDIIQDTIRQHGYTLAINLQLIRSEIEDFGQDVNEEIKIKHTQVENELQAINETYFAIQKNDQQFEGSLVTIQQFRQLNTAEFSVTNFYDEGYQLVNRLNAKKAKDQHAVIVRYNDVDLTYPLITQKTEQVAYIYKKPHKVVAQFWEERYQKLNAYIERQEVKIQTELPEEWQQLTQNLFVDSEYAAIVKANLEEVQSDLEQLKLRLEKIHFSYTSLS